MDDRGGDPPLTLASRTRALTAAEQRLLRARIRDAEARAERAPKVLVPGVVIIVLLAVLTFLASDAPALVVTGFWAVAGAVILVWVFQSTRTDLRQFHGAADAWRSALARNEARVYDIRSTGFAEFEEVEDEGACYAFEIEGGRLVFVSGQRFYPESKFPSHDFSLIHVLDERGEVIDELIEKRGAQAAATVTVPAARKMDLELPDHLDVRAGRIRDIEESLKPTGGA